LHFALLLMALAAFRQLPASPPPAGQAHETWRQDVHFLGDLPMLSHYYALSKILAVKFLRRIAAI